MGNYIYPPTRSYRLEMAKPCPRLQHPLHPKMAIRSSYGDEPAAASGFTRRAYHAIPGNALAP